MTGYFVNFVTKIKTNLNLFFFRTEVRWFSKANCLGRFYSLPEEADSQQVKDVQKAKFDVAYLLLDTTNSTRLTCNFKAV